MDSAAERKGTGISMNLKGLYEKLTDIGKRNLTKRQSLYCDGQHLAKGLRNHQEQPCEKIPITIFQAPLAALVEKGTYWDMLNFAKPFSGDVPAEYYLAVFNGKIECTEQLPKDPEKRQMAILELIFRVFNTTHPAGYAGRSLSMGDVVRLEGRDYLCVAMGFVPISFESGQKTTPVPTQTICELALPDGTKLRASTHDDTEYCSINIDLLSTDGTHELVCFVEHNPEKPQGQRLCIGVYRAGEDEPYYYNNYHRK